MYQLLEPYMEQAISNAKNLANINKAKRLRNPRREQRYIA